LRIRFRLARWLPFGYAFGAGMVTTVSPCGIAMLPAYVSLYLEAKESLSGPITGAASVESLLMSAVVRSVLCFFRRHRPRHVLGGQYLTGFIPGRQSS